MKSSVKQGLIGLAIVGASLLPFNRASAQPPMPGNEKLNSEWVVKGETFNDAGVAALAHSEDGTSIGLVVYRGQNDFDKTEDEMKQKFEAYMKKKGIDGKAFIETIPQNSFSKYMIYVAGRSPTPNEVYSNDFAELFPKMIEKQRELDKNRVAAATGLSYNK